MADGTLTLDREAMKLLASDTRVDLLKELDERQMTVSELARALDLHKATVHEHLQKLLDAELVERWETERKWVYYALTWKGRRLLHPDKIDIAILLSTAVGAVAAGAVAAWAWWANRAPGGDGGASEAADVAADRASEATDAMGTLASVEPMLAAAVAFLLLAILLVGGAWGVRRTGRGRDGPTGA